MSGSRRALIALAVGGVVTIGVLAAVLFLVPVGAKVADDTYVAGVAVGGLSRSQLEGTLEGRVGELVTRKVTVRVDDGPEGVADSFTVSPADLGISLDVGATADQALPAGDGTLIDRLRSGAKTRTDLDAVLEVDAAKAQKALASDLEAYHQDAENADITTPTPVQELDVKGDTSFTAHTVAGISVSAGRDGIDVDAAQTLATIRATLVKGGTETSVKAKSVAPVVGTDELKKVDQVIGTFTTAHACCAPRVTNIHRIAQIVDGSLVMPGKEFSLNEKTGRRTAADGFVPAGAIAEGEIVDQVGGGVSQFSTTFYNASWFSGIDIVKHQPHSKYISRYPPGREATLDYDQIQNIVENDTDAPIVIRTMTTATTVTVTLYGHTGDRRVTSTTTPTAIPADGRFTTRLVRQVSDGGKVRTDGDDRYSWTYTGLD